MGVDFVREKQEIAVVWFKRDLRLVDHEPLFYAQNQPLPILLIYCFEPTVMNYPDSDIRHWRFVFQSLQDMQQKLNANGSNLNIFHAEALFVFEELNKKFDIKVVFSHQEIGNKITYDRDKAFTQFCKEKHITWTEFQHNGVVRGLKSRKNWEQLWKLKMQETIKPIHLESLNTIKLESDFFLKLKGPDLPSTITQPNLAFQPGGTQNAMKYLTGFLTKRHVNYSKHISRPEDSRTSCSRISPYLSYGNLSIRFVYQYTQQHYQTALSKKALQNFISRLYWHCHFMQKFENECSMEFYNVNSAFDAIVKPKNQAYIVAWQTGNTGVPLVDACMRCLAATGYLNFRMRALVVSFFVFNLWQDWRELHFLAQQFLDYEPGIHYPQLQMQAGVTGINTVRIYNPIKNSQTLDAEGTFIKKWIPELASVPLAFIHEPWKMTDLDQALYKITLGKDYPKPIIDIEATRKMASQIIWDLRKTPEAKAEGNRILQKHVNTTPRFKPKSKRK